MVLLNIADHIYLQEAMYFVIKLIQDFEDKKDKIFIGSIKKLKLKNKGKDLFAKVKGAARELSKKGKYFV